MHSTETEGFCWAELPPDDVLAVLTARARTGGQATSGFLDTHQWAPLAGRPELTIDGGHPSAQFRRVALGAAGIAVGYYRLARTALPEHIRSARQLRAWLYGAGAADSSLGDIVLGDDALLAADPAAGLANLGLPLISCDGWQPPVAKATRSTAASSRADAVVGTLFKVSRGEAQTAIKFGFVYVNFRPLAKRTQALSAGDQVVYRTKGRAEVFSIETNPKSGRVWVEFTAYPA
ncbi:hypothetical protein JW859_03660 [bacterium]|nr:hypothetical protein [bacterium]